MKFPAARLALLLCASVLCACARGEDGPVPLYRFVEPSLEAHDDSLPPLATLDDETRPTLVGYRFRTLLRSRKVRVAPGGVVVMHPHLPGSLRGAGSLLVRPRVLRGKRWQLLSERVVPVHVRSDGLEAVQFSFKLDRGGRRRKLSLQAMPVPAERDPVHETPAVRIPRGARLEFGIGLMASGPKQSPVEFSIDVCRGLDCEPFFERTIATGEPGGTGWDDHALSLDALAGRLVSFRFRTRHLQPEPEAFAFPVWSDPTVFAPGRVPGPRFIVISLDTLRADHLPWHGYHRQTAPRMDAALVPRATVFEDCVAPASTTGPSHMTMFTSVQPLVHGVRRSLGSDQIPAGLRTLAQLLRAGGLTTAAVTENGPLGVHKGFGRGFDSFRENKERKQRSAFSGRAGETFATARTWLERNGEKRFFLFVHTYETHTPYLAPSLYDRVFADDPDLERFDRIPEGERPIDYDREIRYADHEVAEFISWLGERDLLEDTVLIVTSDHGEAFLEHGFRFHGATLFQEIVHVPLVIAGPGIEPGRVPVPVGLIDLMPTVLELAGLPANPEAHGRSLVPWLRGGSVDPEPWMSRALYSEAWQTHAAGLGLFNVRQPTFAVRRGQRKLIRYLEGDGHRYELYDLRNDDREQVNLYGQLPEAARELQTLIERYEPISAELRASLQVAPGDDAEDDAIDPDREEKLRALGYID